VSILLVVNSGSSSIKYQLFDMDDESGLAKGLVERVGTGHGVITHAGPDGEEHQADVSVLDHSAGLTAMLDACARWGPVLEDVPVAAVGHRVVQGGSRFVAPTVIDDAVIRTIDEISPLAPLHNPPNLLGIRAARDAFPDVPHVAVFDTAFHQTMPEEASTYAIDANLARQYRIRRYGFHGTSHKYVSEQAAAFLGRPLDQVNTIVLHLGNGASACAVRGGVSVDTSMGMTPLEGLVMGTRGGDIDPGVLIHLNRVAEMSIDQLDDLLNRRSGLLGMTGTADMRDVLAAAEQGDARAELALAVTCHRLKGYVGAYVAHLGRVDAIAFTAGIGENAPGIRRRSLDGLAHMGIQVDPTRNAAPGDGVRRISPDDSPVAVLVVPTNEELEIARQTLVAIGNG
jgi:acetate kinase